MQSNSGKQGESVPLTSLCPDMVFSNFPSYAPQILMSLSAAVTTHTEGKKTHFQKSVDVRCCCKLMSHSTGTTCQLCQYLHWFLQRNSKYSLLPTSVHLAYWLWLYIHNRKWNRSWSTAVKTSVLKMWHLAHSDQTKVVKTILGTVINNDDIKTANRQLFSLLVNLPYYCHFSSVHLSRKCHTNWKNMLMTFSQSPKRGLRISFPTKRSKSQTLFIYYPWRWRKAALPCI